MKIAFIVPEFPSLSQTFVLNQITGLIDRGHQVDIFAPRAGEENEIPPEVIHYKLLSNTSYLLILPDSKTMRAIRGLFLILRHLVKKPLVILNSLNVLKYGRQAASLYLLFQCVAFLNKNHYDVIHCHFGPFGNLGVIMREIGAIQGRVSTVFHGYDLTSFLKKTGDSIYAGLFQKGDLFLPVSNTWKTKLVKLGCPEDKVFVHRMGIDTERFGYRPNRVKRDNMTNILTVARLVEKKGVRHGVQAIAGLLKETFQISYSIAGDGPLKKELLNLIDRLNLHRRVKILGWVPPGQISKLMDEADILLAPSLTDKDGDQEGIPVVVMEAMAKGVPVVSTYHSGIPEIISDGKTGLLVEEGDVDGLVAKLAYLIRNPKSGEVIGREAKKFIKAHYDINRLNDRLADMFQKITAG